MGVREEIIAYVRRAVKGVDYLCDLMVTYKNCYCSYLCYTIIIYTVCNAAKSDSTVKVLAI